MLRLNFGSFARNAENLLCFKRAIFSNLGKRRTQNQGNRCSDLIICLFVLVPVIILEDDTRTKKQYHHHRRRRRRRCHRYYIIQQNKYSYILPVSFIL